jgi:AbrB family transcriptional regulator (stage V sporulation protein T)
MNPIEGVDRFAVACAPIMADGDVNGAVIMLSDKDNSAVDEKTKALVEAAAMYFGKQMEDV